ncbi:Intracellular protein transport protein [Madurella fahalii]|uniref:Intracellular protein transport protein n=1 Tax=Madurella fahalii TaxID=1157608 RepID=A0ABQ0FZC4_9PEZI
MVALDPAPPEGGRPPPSPESDTASASSEAASGPQSPRPVPLPLDHHETLDQTDAFPELPELPDLPLLSKHPLPSSRSRSVSLAQISGPVKRKPLSSTASPVAVRYSTRAYADAFANLPRPEQRFARSCSLDSPTLYEFPDHRSLLATSALNNVSWSASPESSQPSSPAAAQFVQPSLPPADAGDVPQNTAGSNPAAAQTKSSEVEGLSAESASLASQESDPYGLDYHIPDSPESQGPRRTTIIDTNTRSMSMFARKSPPPHLNFGSNQDRDVPATSASPLERSNLNKPLPKSPASSKLSAFFGWATSPSPSPTTDFSDKGFSPLPSPSSPKATTVVTESYETPLSAKDRSFSNATDQSPLRYCESYLQTPADSTTSLGQLEEMEDELKAISAELAASIRREIDLEDLVEKLQEQVNNAQAPGKRTSDYYSDSGYSSAKFSDYDQAKEEISQIQRRAEQERAQLRLELTNKLQDERDKRRLLDQQIQELSKKASEVDVSQIDAVDASGRIKELESMCEDLSRRLSEEREVKSNFEDLLDALKGELQTASNERDNLRDEIVPQLRARVEGLEAEASEHAKLAYDTSKMQQELELLRSENSELKQTGTRMSMALSRSASVTAGSYRKNRPQSISRSSSTRPTEPREVLAERLKDVEAQRDALHSALKSLLERQELQNRENTKRIRQLEMERDRLLSASPKKAGYEREVSNLRDEINVLRRRAEEAIEQKWQVEKGLGGLKMDLDRAEEEIRSLRSLLKEKDILIPETLARSSSYDDSAFPVTSASLEKAYQELQKAYAEALEHIKKLEETTGSDERMQLAIQRLEQSLSTAISERDLAQMEATSCRTQLESLRASEKQHFVTERNLADQLHESARRVEELAQQVRAQLEINSALRNRLADTIARGEAEQRVSTERIAGLQNRLRKLEEQVVAAQTGAEERVARHEEELAQLKDAHSSQLQRLRDASGDMRGRRLFPPKSPLSPMFSTRSASMSVKSPRMSTPLLSPYPASGRPVVRRSSTAPLDGDAAAGMTAQVETLKGRVAELEGALAAADAEMQEVVGRMNTAQIEVLSLQEQREDAVRETRRLQRLIEEERVRMFEGRFRSLTTEVM